MQNKVIYQTITALTISNHVDLDDVIRLLGNYKVNDNGCWVRGETGNYTTIKLKDGRTLVASRFSVEVFTGVPVPYNRLACHKCENPPCINPDHLSVGTTKDNMRDAVNKGRIFTSVLTRRSRLIAAGAKSHTGFTTFHASLDRLKYPRKD